MGFYGGLLCEIVKCVGVMFVGFLYYFVDKEELFVEVLCQCDEVVCEVVGDFVEYILIEQVKWVVVYNQILCGLILLYVIVFVEVIDLEYLLYVDFVVCYWVRVDEVVEIFCCGQEVGEVWVDIDLEFVVWLISVVMDGIQLQWFLDEFVDMVFFFEEFVICYFDFVVFFWF